MKSKETSETYTAAVEAIGRLLAEGGMVAGLEAFKRAIFDYAPAETPKAEIGFRARVYHEVRILHSKLKAGNID